MKKLYMIGNAHLDPVWLWQWNEGAYENKATFLSALDRLDEFEDFVFTSSSAQLYEWLEASDPEIIKRIKHWVEVGRWVLCGGWWIQPDCNLPSGESFARQALIAQNYFLDTFGVSASVGYCVDSFGHNGMLPQILCESAMDSYVFMRPEPHEKEIPENTFIWESPDGSQVTVFRIPIAYNSFENTQEHVKKVALLLDEQHADKMMCFYGVGNHGGGPTIKNIKTIRQLKEELICDVSFSSPNEYFADIRKQDFELPIVKGDLQHHAIGCYSVHSEIKRLNRKAENALIRSEKVSTLADILKCRESLNNFKEAWKQVLFNQFHDILAGSSILDAYEDARNDLGRALSIAKQQEIPSLMSITGKMRTLHTGTEFPVVVFNPHSWVVKDFIEVEIQQNFHNDHYAVVDDHGNPVPRQYIQSRGKTPGITALLFPVTLPPCGFATYGINKLPPSAMYDACDKEDSSIALENEHFCVRFNRLSGAITQLIDKELEIEYFHGEGAIATVYDDDSDTWSHNVKAFDTLLEHFVCRKIEKIEEGPVRDCIRVYSTYNRSSLIQRFTLYKNEKILRVTADLHWHEQFKCLKINFPLAIEDGKVTYEIPFGNIVKSPDGHEEAMQRWFDLSGRHAGHSGRIGMTIINDCKYSASVKDNMMSMTILRSPVAAHHYPYSLQDSEIFDYPFIDQGPQSFSYTMYPHSDSCSTSEATRLASVLNEPPLMVRETYHDGTLDSSFSCFSIDSDHVVLSALKIADRRDQIVIRCYETCGIAETIHMRIPPTGKKISLAINPYEIKTIGFDIAAGTYQELNFCEWEKE